MTIACQERPGAAKLIAKRAGRGLTDMVKAGLLESQCLVVKLDTQRKADETSVIRSLIVSRPELLGAEHL